MFEYLRNSDFSLLLSFKIHVWLSMLFFCSAGFCNDDLWALLESWEGSLWNIVGCLALTGWDASAIPLRSPRAPCFDTPGSKFTKNKRDVHVSANKRMFSGLIGRRLNMSSAVLLIQSAALWKRPKGRLTGDGLSFTWINSWLVTHTHTHTHLHVPSLGLF